MLVACLQTLGAVASSATDEEARGLTKMLLSLLDFENLKEGESASPDYEPVDASVF